MATAGSLLQWQSTAPMPTKRVFATSVVHKNFLYIIGGCDVSGVPLDAMEMYDGHKKWKRLMSMPTRRAGTAAVVVEDKIISMAGVAESQEPLDAVEIFDTNARTWSVVEPLGEALLGISAVTRDNKILVVGGMGLDTNPRDTFVEFDVADNKWQKLPSMPTARYAAFTFIINNKLYVIGGRQGKLPTAAFEVYDFSEKKWTKLPDIPSKRVFAMYTASDTHIFSVGGLRQPATEGFSDACEVFDIAAGTWKLGASMPTKRADFAVGILHDRLVCAGGLGNEGKPLAIVESYCPSTDKWQQEKPMPSTHCSCSYLVHNGCLYVAGGLSLQGASNCIDVLQFK
ncbi:kelch domain-containing protein 8A-like [Pomacea canaliculata]|uniref:kelch domain-containing protein 8A-like n=1 Tax=Pomacea canaliculata TaxID=400727 RepID=UPI000D732471|nr:kelch domain-containing protein 8A-like [Pomacea canaliculata]XP_025107323.1 kelch domain-containing protein 8A-like [Pomacea canaliculata]XP_025107324.1 kelch domain-containing protein 8A-like [Pomacea canaliculata]